MTKQEVKKMTELLSKIRDKSIIVNEFDSHDWQELLKREPEGYSWREEAYLAGDDYIEDGKEFLRSN
jgi:hypothetical protein